MTAADLLAARLVRHQLEAPHCASPAELAAWFGALQAQDYSGVKWSLGTRLSPFTNAWIEQALQDKQIVRTWLLRGTLHVAAAQDIRWMLALSGPRTIAQSAGVFRQAGVTEPHLNQAFYLLRQLLQGGHCLTRPEVLGAWEEAGLATGGQRGYLMLSRAAQTGLICLGPLNGKQQTFVLLDEWVPGGKTMGRNEALAELVRRYFTSRGPATLKDCAWWTGLPLGDIKIGLEQSGSSLTNEELDDETYWFPAGQGGLAAPPGRALLLSGFDEYFLGYTDRRLVVDAAHHPLLYPKNAVYPSMMVLNGRVVGLWTDEVRKDSLNLELAPFVALSGADKTAFETACADCARFWGPPAAVTWKEPSPR